jgi:hypothetical protein
VTRDPTPSTGALGTEPAISDEELAAAALTADPDAPIPADATPFGAEQAGPDLLPGWYMPPPRGYRRTPGRRLAVVGVIVALVVVNGAGLCVTYGWPEIAW